MSANKAPDLASVLTPFLFHAVQEHLFPFSKDSALDFKKVGNFLWRTDRNPDDLKHITWPALKALSTMGVSNIPDLMSFLPAPDSKDFPDQALGLTLLLDQAPRTYFEGIDIRYQPDYFDVLALRLAYQLRALPRPLRPDSQDRWTKDLGYSFDYWILIRFFFVAPFAHSQQLHDSLLQVSMIEETRLAVEEQIRKSDPYRGGEEIKLSTDTEAFSRKVQKGPPNHADTRMEDFVFWQATVFDVHLPILLRFGRYPYYAAAQGKELTKEEVDWLELTRHSGEIARGDVAARIKDDVLAGKWTPLGDN